MSTHEFLVVGAGIAGLACARVLSDVGSSVVLHERERVGGRARTAEVGGRAVDVGAAYFTASIPVFTDLVAEWVEREVVTPWTDTFHVATPDGVVGTHSGPMRYVAPGGLGALAAHLAEGLEVVSGCPVRSVSAAGADGNTYAGIVLTPPSPQVLAVLDDSLVAERDAAAERFDPCIVVVLEYPDRAWLEFDATFINDSAALTFVVDDGHRAADDHPTLVAYTSPVLSAAHLDDPERVIEPVLAELGACLGVTAAPTSVQTFRWPHAKPRHPRSEPFFLGEHGVGICGDGWHAPSRLQSAYLSGRALGRALRDSGGR